MFKYFNTYFLALHVRYFQEMKFSSCLMILMRPSMRQDWKNYVATNRYCRIRVLTIVEFCKSPFFT